MRKSLVFLVVLPLLAFSIGHKFYVTVTNVNYSDKDDAFQVTTRIFIDDFEEVLKERYGIDAYLATDKESAIADEYIEKYLRTKFLVHLNGEQATYNFIGKKYDDDVVICYIEIPDVGLETLKTMEFDNEILTDLFDEQKNIVHVKWNGNKRSFVMIKSNAKGMLNF
ncbi:MAG: DUF6702 family protein [Croceivirga sp.]